jgi:hypothetical protein
MRYDLNVNYDQIMVNNQIIVNPHTIDHLTNILPILHGT